MLTGRSTSSLLSSSRPTSSSTTGDDIDSVDEKIVYNEREDKLRDLLDKMRSDHDAGKTAQPSREARVRRYLKEIQAQNANEASLTKIMSQGPVELDASVSQYPTVSRLPELCPDPASHDEHFPYESAKASLVLCESLENERYYQPLPSIDLSQAFDADFSAATARALNGLPSPQPFNSFDRAAETETAKTPTPKQLPKAQPDYFETGSNNHVSSRTQPSSPNLEAAPVLKRSSNNRVSTAKTFTRKPLPKAQPDYSETANSNRISPRTQASSPNLEAAPVLKRSLINQVSTAKTFTPTILPEVQTDYLETGSNSHISPRIHPSSPTLEVAPVLKPMLFNRDSTASTNSSQAASDKMSVSTRESGDIVGEAREVSIQKITRLGGPAPPRSIFSDLDNLVRASRTRH